MGTYLSTSADPRTRLLLLAAFFITAAPSLRAGSVITLTNGAEADGKLSVVAAGIHVDTTGSQPDTALTDVLESSFGNDPFKLNVLYVDKGNQLPPDWKAQDVGPVDETGTATLQDGTFTLTGGGLILKPDTKGTPPPETLYFVGQPWTDNGQFTVRLKDWDTQAFDRSAGLMMRESFESGAAMCAISLTPQGVIRLPFRHEAHKGGGAGDPGNGDVPLWMRFTRRGNTLYASVSQDGIDWNILNDFDLAPSRHEDGGTLMPNAIAGLYVGHHKDKFNKAGAKAIFDQVSVTPLPSTAQVLPAGVLLQGGSILAGRFAHISFDPAEAQENGTFWHGGAKSMQIARSLVAGVLTLPIERTKLTQMAAKASVLMRNGDTMDGDVSSISSDTVSISSVLLGITNYRSVEVRGCFVKPLQLQPAAYEVRLRDGSILNATAVTGDASEVVITDVSGLSIQADADDVAQIRAGTSQVQTLAQLDWKVTPPVGTSATTPATNAAPAPAMAPADAAAGNNNGAPAAPAPPPPIPLVQSWLGPNQEQVMATGMGTAIEFPLPGRFRAMGVQVALSSDSPPNATTTIHLLADGREIAKSPPFRAGDPPRFMEVTLQNAAHITLQAESIFPNVKVLYLDPVAIK